MSETLIIAIIGQVITLVIVLMQQIFNNKNIKKQHNLELKKIYYNDKREAYKKLMMIVNLNVIKKLDLKNLYKNIDYFYKDILIYSSSELTDKVFEFHDLSIKILSLKENNAKENKITKLYNDLAFINGQIHAIVRKELKEFYI